MRLSRPTRQTTALSQRRAERRVISMMRLKSLSPVEVTAVSRIPGTQGIQEDTEGHDELGG